MVHRKVAKYAKKNYKLGRYRDKRLSFDSAQDDVTLSGVEVLSTLKFPCINLKYYKHQSSISDHQS